MSILYCRIIPSIPYKCIYSCIIQWSSMYPCVLKVRVLEPACNEKSEIQASVACVFYAASRRASWGVSGVSHCYPGSRCYCTSGYPMRCYYFLQYGIRVPDILSKHPSETLLTVKSLRFREKCNVNTPMTRVKRGLNVGWFSISSMRRQK